MEITYGELFLFTGWLITGLYAVHCKQAVEREKGLARMLLVGIATKQVGVKLDSDGDIEIFKGENYVGN